VDVKQPAQVKKRESGDDDEADFADVEEEAFTLVPPMTHSSANCSWLAIATHLQVTLWCPALAPAPSLSIYLSLSLDLSPSSSRESSA